MADSKVVVLDQAPVGLATKNADTEQLAGVGGANVERQRFQISGAALLEIARVKAAAPAPADMALVTRTLLYAANGDPLLLATYLQDTVVALANGTPIMYKDDGVPNTLRIPSSSHPLPVDIGAGGLVVTNLKGGTGGVVSVRTNAPAIATDPAMVVTLSPNNGVDVTDRAGRLIGTADLIDADTRILGRTKLRDSLNNVIDPMPKAGGSVDVTDRAARVLGRSQILDSASAVIDPATKAQLPAALVGGRLDVNVGAAVSLPVTVVDGGDVAQGAKADAVWDGVTVATTISAVMKYIGQKVEAARALLAGFLKFGERENGYAHLAMYAEAVAGIIAETAISMNLSRAFAAPAAATSNGAAAAKELVITGIMVAWISTSTTANTVRLRIRVNPAGAAVIGSPIALTIRLAWESATFIANEGSWQTLMFPKPIVIPNPGQFMATLACVAANGTLDVQLLGYERTP